MGTHHHSSKMDGNFSSVFFSELSNSFFLVFLVFVSPLSSVTRLLLFIRRTILNLQDNFCISISHLKFASQFTQRKIITPICTHAPVCKVKSKSETQLIFF